MTAQKAAMRKIVAFCHETTSHVHLVAHPRKGQTEDKAPGKLDVAGSGHITNGADNVFVVWSARKEVGHEDEKPDASLELVKDRNGEAGHRKIYLFFAVRPSSTRRMPIVGALIHRVQRPDTAGIAVLRYIAPRRFGGWRCALPGSPSETAPRLSWACAWCSPLPTTRNHLRTHHA